jgi:hypothetical protein
MGNVEEEKNVKKATPNSHESGADVRLSRVYNPDCKANYSHADY